MIVSKVLKNTLGIGKCGRTLSSCIHSILLGSSIGVICSLFCFLLIVPFPPLSCLNNSLTGLEHSGRTSVVPACVPPFRIRLREFPKSVVAVANSEGEILADWERIHRGALRPIPIRFCTGRFKRHSNVSHSRAVCIRKNTK